MSDLDVLFPDRDLAVGGKSLMLKPLSFGQLPRAAKLLQPIAKAVNAAGLFALDAASGAIRMVGDWPMRLIDVTAESGDAVMAFLALATGEDPAWISALNTDDGVLLVRSVLEMNADFFVQRVLPVIAPQGSPIGDTASQPSLQPATVAPTSTDIPSTN